MTAEKTEKSEKKSSTTLGTVAKVVCGLVAVGLLSNVMDGGLETAVAADSERDYATAKRAGSLMDRCIHAGLVRAAYLSAGDDAKLREWTAIERADCAAAYDEGAKI